MLSREQLIEAAHSPTRTADAPPIVLVVDDHPDTLEMYGAMLQSEGFWVARASGALEALEYAQDLHPDAVIADLGLPGPMNGADLIRELGADAVLGDVPVLAVTGRAPKHMPSLAGLKMSALLLKPVAPVTLVSRLRAAIEHSATLRARSAEASNKVAELLHRSAALIAQTKVPSPPRAAEKRDRKCPGCGTALQWLETGKLQRVTYDYYRWCGNGCGLYCFNRGTGEFERLAGGRD
jgi:CheY-like chemotaxis protein